MLVCRLMRVRLVVGVDGSRSVHYRRKLQWLISKRSAYCKPRNFELRPENARCLGVTLCEICRCETNKKCEQSSTWTWIAFTRRSKFVIALRCAASLSAWVARSEEHTSELQSRV